ncbi:recombinase family protein [Streptomyces mirabilis]|uniref:recombinase family protein n=1 Tax=Streptomyces mirabilis TaxID=68239 RepID=UPI003325A908
MTTSLATTSPLDTAPVVDTFGRTKPVRVLIALRISYLTDESTSLERQLFDARDYVGKKVTQGLNWVEVGIARDDHVSATKQSPFERAELGHWINEDAPEFDLILFWRLDRFIRKVMDMQDMLRWADDHGNKAFASITEAIFDMTGPFRHHPGKAALAGRNARLLDKGNPESPAETADELNARKEPTPRGRRADESPVRSTDHSRHRPDRQQDPHGGPDLH